MTLHASQWQVLDSFAPGGLHGVLKDSAVWLCPGEEAIKKLDTLCFGNLDGGPGTGAEITAALGSARCAGTQAVRLGLDEAFFLAYAVGLLKVYCSEKLTPVDQDNARNEDSIEKVALLSVEVRAVVELPSDSCLCSVHSVVSATDLLFTL